MRLRVYKGRFSGYWRVLESGYLIFFDTWREAFDWAYAHATQHKEEE